MNSVHKSLLTVAALAGSAWAQNYTIIDLTPAHGFAQAWSISESGRVAGGVIQTVAEGGHYRAFDWNGAASVLAPPVGSKESLALIARDDDVAGVAFSLGTLEPVAVEGSGGGLVGVGAFEPHAVNAGGVYAGWAWVTDSSGLRIHTAVRFDGVVHTLPGLGGLGSSALGIDNAGNVVGDATLTNGIHSHAVFWPAAGGITDLGTLGGNWSQAMAINASLAVAGHARTAPGDVHAFITQVGPDGSVLTRTDLGVLAGNFSYAADINDAGQVVGTSNDRAFLWDGSALVDLNDRVPASGWTLTHAAGINNAGEIVGWGTLGNRYAAFKLVPGCIADVIPDGTLDFFDVQAFLGLFAAHDPRADLNGDGLLDFFDVLAFLNAFSAGCP